MAEVTERPGGPLGERFAGGALRLRSASLEERFALGISRGIGGGAASPAYRVRWTVE
jgi:hypothetical protein